MSSTASPWHDISLSLAGVVQACALVDQLAKEGLCPTPPLETCIKSLWELNPRSTEAVFGSVGALRLGLETLEPLLENSHNTQQAQLLRYCMGVFHLERKLARNPNMLNTLGQRLDKSRTALEMFGPTHENTLASLGEIYRDTLSTFNLRIQVFGEQHHLQQPHIAHNIRALLLCAIRAARLWHQVGGRRWHWLFYRKAMRRATTDLIQQAKREQLQAP